jgi:S1-C subfamily serine protease
MKILLRITNLVLVLATVPLIDLNATTVPEFVANAEPAVVQIVAVDAKLNPCKTGTGFFISSDGVLITSNHVIAGATDLFARTSTGAVYLFRGVVFRSVDLDLVFLKFAGTGVPYLRLGGSAQAVEGQRVVVICRPEGRGPAVTVGIISAFRNNRSSIQITALMPPGSSGSPVLDESGQVIGVTTSVNQDGDSLNRAIAADALERAFLAESKQPANNDSQTSMQP